jgi:hypothetical protein
MSARRGGIPGPESRTGLARPSMSEAEFERRLGGGGGAGGAAAPPDEPELAPAAVEPAEAEPQGASARAPRSRATGQRARPARVRRVQRMFAIEEDLDRKLWLYAIHVGKDRSEVVNDLLRPTVASMVLYDSRDRRAARDPGPGGRETGPDGESG